MNERFPQPTSSQEAVPTTTNLQQESTDKKAEILLNPRIQQLMQARDEAERQLQETIVRIAERENDQNYISAKNLFASGWMLHSYENNDGFTIAILSNKITGERIDLDDRNEEEELFDEGIAQYNFGKHFNVTEEAVYTNTYAHLKDLTFESDIS